VKNADIDLRPTIRRGLDMPDQHFDTALGGRGIWQCSRES
jgi:hypothetical protein